MALDGRRPGAVETCARGFPSLVASVPAGQRDRQGGRFESNPADRNEQGGERSRGASTMRDLPFSKVYQLIEPGSVVLLTTAHKGRRHDHPGRGLAHRQ